ncbi:hypothetical protein A8F94_16285 [Bacillus sp. FJAT-27225]|uniref:hypothetical protein n=1 Tax=Bacillus sp. FJAT-27225 TaxID=1743144 RepID=UPI00080C32E4|nr:hypothetical protein [Bacillus sp. FJAT-27225]OCA84271.1 hypothetical protein A8F94_16285 [Bacillus sp. FJAT-27225]
MEKAVIVGAFGFFGFHLCKKMLEKGYEVAGVAYGKESASFQDEMEDLIGRNGNFQKTFNEVPGGGSQSEVLILSLYDWIYCEDESDVIELLRKTISPNNQRKTVLAVPIELALNSEKAAMIVDLIQQEQKNTLTIYLPTLFGPYQPERYAFQKAISGFRDHDPSEEYIEDALYCEDAAEKAIELIEQGRKRDVLLKSSSGANWQACAEILGIPTPIRNQSRFKPVAGLEIVEVPASITNEEGLDLQKRVSMGAMSGSWFLP